MIAPRRPRWLPNPEQGESTFIGSLLRQETVGGAVALAAAVIAVLWANLAGDSYQHVRALTLGPLDLEHWAADGALTLFFFLAGLEVKRELLVGSLRRPADAAVPIVAALGGVALPALIFALVNLGTGNLGGWAIPSATDIAFALAVLALVGSSLPGPLRAFLLTLAVVDDLVVILIIVVFYSSTLHVTWLLGALALLAAYGVGQRLRIRTSLLYVPLGVAVWYCTHESGVHATVAGVALGLLTRVLPDETEKHSPAERLEHRLTPLSAGVAVPFFALMSAGVPLAGGLEILRDRVALGALLGLVVGKPVGVLTSSWLLTRVTRAQLNESLSWRDVVGVACLAGVGFTVSLLVSDLSFPDVRAEDAKAAVLAASVVAALLGAVLLGRRNRVHAAS